MDVALTIATRSTCNRAHVGAALVKGKHIISTGYNGSIAGFDHCDDVGHLMVEGHCVRTVHAEANAVIQAAIHGVSTAGASCYVTHFPCINCTKILLNGRIARLVYLNDYRINPIAHGFFQEANVELVDIKSVSDDPRFQLPK